MDVVLLGTSKRSFLVVFSPPNVVLCSTHEVLILANVALMTNFSACPARIKDSCVRCHVAFPIKPYIPTESNQYQTCLGRVRHSLFVGILVKPYTDQPLVFPKDSIKQRGHSLKLYSSRNSNMTHGQYPVLESGEKTPSKRSEKSRSAAK